MRKLIIFVLATQITCTYQLHSQKTKTQPAIADKFVLVDGHKMHYQIAGNGSPTVVFEAGHSSTLRDWSDIFPAISKMTRAVSHDRLGMGSSEESDKPRTYKQIALELHTMLEQANIPPPYILVGHSMGGAIVRAFSNLYRDETAGLVLIDPFNEYETNHISKEILENEMKMMDSTMSTAPSTVRKEFNFLRREMEVGFPELKSLNFSDIPTALLVAGNDRPPHWAENAVDLYQEKISSLSDARLIVLKQSPHYIQQYDPTTVIEVTRRIIYPDAEIILKKVLREKGVDSTIAAFKRIRLKYPKDLFPERILNTLGYLVLDKDAPAAVKLFSLNVSLYPESSNVYDSLGEAYMVERNKEQAIKNYEKSLVLDPNNKNAVNMLKKLKAN